MSEAENWETFDPQTVAEASRRIRLANARVVAEMFGDPKLVDAIKRGTVEASVEVVHDPELADALRRSKVGVPSEDKTPRYSRERLPECRQSITHKFSVGGHEGYAMVGMYPDGRPGELFIRMAKEGSTVGGMMDALGIAVSIGLQSGVPLEVFVAKYAHSRFEPSGMTSHPKIRFASSIPDYVFRWMALGFLGPEAASVSQDEPARLPTLEKTETASVATEVTPGPSVDEMIAVPKLTRFEEAAEIEAEVGLGMVSHWSEDENVLGQKSAQSWGMPCENCGAIMTRMGGCWGCTRCFQTGPCG